MKFRVERLGNTFLAKKFFAEFFLTVRFTPPRPELKIARFGRRRRSRALQKSLRFSRILRRHKGVLAPEPAGAQGLEAVGTLESVLRSDAVLEICAVCARLRFSGAA